MKLSNINSCVRAQSLSLVQLFETLWIVAYKAPLYVGFLRQEYWSAKLKKKKKKNTGVHCPFLQFLHWEADSLLLSHLGSPATIVTGFISTKEFGGWKSTILQ